MPNNYQIGFIGLGKMGSAIVQGIINSHIISPDKICFYEKSEQVISNAKQKYNIFFKPLSELISTSNIVFFCIKPQNLNEIFTLITNIDVTGKLFVSILAGTKIAAFEDKFGPSSQVLRVMPNTPAVLGQGMSVLAFNNNVTADFQNISLEIFSALGQVQELQEKYMDIVTGISGSGPAFLYKIADIIARVGQENGLEYEVSLKLIAQTFVGAGEMLLKSSKSPNQLISDVSSPNGTTVAGLEVLNKSNIEKVLKKTVNRSIARSIEISNNL